MHSLSLLTLPRVTQRHLVTDQVTVTHQPIISHSTTQSHFTITEVTVIGVTLGDTVSLWVTPKVSPKVCLHSRSLHSVCPWPIATDHMIWTAPPVTLCRVTPIFIPTIVKLINQRKCFIGSCWVHTVCLQTTWNITLLQGDHDRWLGKSQTSYCLTIV